MNVECVEKKDYQALIKIWEESVRTTHDFLAQEDLIALKPLILDHYFDAVVLTCVRDKHGAIIGFCGTHEGNIEMLFISPAARGNGVGTLLTRHAIEEFGVTNVDVNEQNAQALGFYQRMGFAIIGRSPLDGQGKPYPLLHMQLSDTN